MPVLSPHRSSASALAGSYRSTFSSSTIDRPYFSSTSYSPRITSYSERYTSRSYADSDGRRSGSITEDGISSRFREEGRETSVRRDSLSRDSGISSIRENSIADFPRRDGSISRDNPRLSAINVLDSVAELRNKYSPANYVPACLREKNENISRSKSINDIGLPPIEPKAIKKKVNDSLNYNNSIGVSNSNTTNDNMKPAEDDNGNRASVADLRRKFDEKAGKAARAQPALEIEGAAVKISENRFKKQDSLEATLKNGGPKKGVKKIKTTNDEKSSGRASKPIDDQTTCQTSDSDGVVSKLDVNDSTIVKNGVGGHDDDDCGEVRKGASRVNNFASYIPSKDYQQRGDCEDPANGDTDQGEEGKTDFINGKRFTDLSTSPKLSSSSTRSAASPSTSTLNSTGSSNSLSRRSVERDTVGYDKYAGPAKTLGLNGLKNIGNTCFMNSVIQCLSNTRSLLEYTLKDLYVADINVNTSSMKGALIKAFAEVIKELWSEDASDRVVNTSSLKSQIQRFAPRFIGYAQQDAQEFLRYLLEGLHEDVNRVKEKPKPILTEIDEKLSDNEKSTESWSRYLRMDNSRIVDYFVGQLKSTLKCTHCGHCSVTFDPFWDLSLPIPQRAGQVRLAQCLDSFTREETLDGDEKPVSVVVDAVSLESERFPLQTCSKCKERRKCTKSFTIQKFPRILVIHLKRFSLAERFRGKLSVTVDFPLEGLDMSHYAADHVTPCRYNLYAISNHSGTTYSGHYTAYCRHPYTKSWHEYNDSRVSPISSKSIVSGEAYVLFYEQEGQKSHL
ncbi:ubiquitin carboxyl-terminal hydrolase 4 [Asbolus verrucosus]|uniref:Ubiquitin carboxyl-terminal hydrolase n=1 Tax=Asbolus verrucosus TaxID=1661398 RepID=A0A482WB56_ASBVE|nr:ubiquitin carboxyl-terminal hydrolase 4 [Asbolus verrucosus]